MIKAFNAKLIFILCRPISSSQNLVETWQSNPSLKLGCISYLLFTMVDSGWQANYPWAQQGCLERHGDIPGHVGAATRSAR